jgi:hypothetical protein
MDARFFYHSFPRRGRSDPTAIEKGCQLLTSIRDLGLLMVPEQIEWKQPHADGSLPRSLRILQRRVCFTELAPRELSEHAEKFGAFALEFDVDTIRSLGALPVFYVPDPSAQSTDGSSIGAALVALALDARSVIARMAGLQEIFDGTTPVADKLQFNTSFTANPSLKNNVTIDTAEAKNLIAALGHGLTPLGGLNAGLGALLNFFYPADNRKGDGLLEYYRQREWRIACEFSILGQKVIRSVAPSEREQILKIDSEFFTRTIDSDFGPVERLSQSLVLSGLHGRRVIQMARRVIVPTDALEQAKSILSSIENAPPVVDLDSQATT